MTQPTPLPEPLSFDVRFALETVLPLCRAAYSHGEIPHDFRLEQCITLAQPLHSDLWARLHSCEDPIGKHFGFIAQSDAVFAVVFRGTETECEWGENLDCALTAVDGIQEGSKVENGFLTVLESLNLPSQLQPRNTQRVVIAGHSLGAALATLYAASMDMLRSDSLELFTFGSPRVGNEAFCRWFDQRHPLHWRIVNHRDLIPKAPLECGGYRHCGQEVRLSYQPPPATAREAHSLTSHCIGLHTLLKAQGDIPQ